VIGAAVIIRVNAAITKKLKALKVSPNLVQREIAQRELTYSNKKMERASLLMKALKEDHQLELKTENTYDVSVSEVLLTAMMVCRSRQ
jgi:hypothetical protein